MQLSIISSIKAAINTKAENSKISKELLFAIAIINSNNGTSKLAVENNNIYGLRGKYNGQSVDINNIPYRVYPTYENAVEDFIDYIINQKNKNKYSAVIGEKDFDKACKAFANAGLYDKSGEKYYKELISSLDSITEEMEPIDSNNFDGVENIVKEEIPKPTTNIEKDFVEDIKVEKKSTPNVVKTYSLHKGSVINIKDCKVYQTAKDVNSKFTLTGRFYIAEDNIYNNRVRIVKEKIQASDRNMYLGFINISDIL